MLAPCMRGMAPQQRMQHAKHGTTHRAAIQLLGHYSVAAVVYDGMVQVVAARCMQHMDLLASCTHVSDP
jgi:hypothetical protein